MDETEEMVKLLLKKAKMLGYHCPRCNLPLFDDGGKVVCVRCGDVRVVKENKVDKNEPERVAGTGLVLEKKREDLLKRLEAEQDPKKIVSLLEAISKIEALLIKS